MFDVMFVSDLLVFLVDECNLDKDTVLEMIETPKDQSKLISMLEGGSFLVFKKRKVKIV